MRASRVLCRRYRSQPSVRRWKQADSLDGRARFSASEWGKRIRLEGDCGSRSTELGITTYDRGSLRRLAQESDATAETQINSAHRSLADRTLQTLNSHNRRYAKGQGVPLDVIEPAPARRATAPASPCLGPR